MNARVRFVGKPGAYTPRYASEGSAGADLHAHLETPLTIAPGARILVPTGLRMEIPRGWEGQVRPRSGLAARNGVTVLNTPGTIDSDYRGEVKVILINLGEEEHTIHDGDRIAQIVFAKVERVELEQASTLENTTRGEGGFGSTGSRA